MTKEDSDVNMNIKEEEMRNVDPIKWFGMIISFTPSLLVKSGGAFLRFKRQAKKGGKVFKKELINQGFDRKTASELTEEYLKGSHLIQTMMKMR
jgi:hypothetical protein